MGAWHPALWLLIMGPCSLVGRTRWPELGWWFSAAANGKKRTIGNSDYSSWSFFFFKYLGAQMGIAGACCWTPAPPSFSGPLVIRSGLTVPLGHADPIPPRTPSEALPTALPSSGAPRGVTGLWGLLKIPSSPVPNLLSVKIFLLLKFF